MQLLLLLSTLLLGPTGSLVNWSVRSVPVEGRISTIELVAEIGTGWHLYAMQLPSDQGPLPTVFRFKASKAYELMGAVKEPIAQEEFDPNFGLMVRHHSGAPRFVQELVRRTPDAFVVEGEIEYMLCNDKICLPPVVVPFTVSVPALEPKN
jgi:hypothetical protein